MMPYEGKAVNADKVSGRWNDCSREAGTHLGRINLAGVPFSMSVWIKMQRLIDVNLSHGDKVKTAYVIRPAEASWKAL